MSNVVEELLAKPGSEWAVRGTLEVRRRDLDAVTAAVWACLASVDEGCRIAVWSEDQAAMALLVLSVMRHAVAVPLPPDAPVDDIVGHLEVTASRHVLVIGDVSDPVVVAAHRAQRPVALLEGIPRVGSGPTPSPRRADDEALVLTTSGTTTRPRSMAHTHAGLIASLGASAASLGLTPSDRCLTTLPLHHVHGLVSGFLLPLWAGGSITLPGLFRADRHDEDVRRSRPTWWSTTPAIHEAMLRVGAPGADEDHLRFLRVGSARLDPTLAARIRERYRVPLVEAYGSTETLQMTGGNPATQPTGSVGGPVGVELRVLDAEGCVVSSGEGKILARGLTVSRDALESDRVIDDGSGNVWYDTGDLGRIDDDGWVWLEGRADELIIRSGENVSPVQVEAAVRSYPPVLEAHVLGVDHPRLGQNVVAFVVPEASTPLDTSDLRRHLSSRLRPAWLPGSILVLEAMPITTTGKPDARALRELVGKEALDKNDAPRSPSVGLVTQIVRDVLDASDIDLDTDLFDLGATSLDLAQVAIRLGNAMRRVVMPVSVLRTPTVRELASWIDGGGNNGEDDIAHRTGPPPALVHSESSVRLPVSPVFVLSAPRTGSTLLRVLLAGHPGLFAPPELRLLGYDTMDGWSGALDGEWAFFREGLLQALVGLGDTLGKARERVTRWAEERAEMGKVYSYLFQRAKPRRLVDKTPTYGLDRETLERMESLFTEPIYLHLTRSPGDMVESFVAASMEQVWMFSGPRDPARLAEEIWAVTVRNTVDHLESIPRFRQHHVRFEDLVTDPTRNLLEVCATLSLDSPAGLLELGEDADRRMTTALKPGSTVIGDPTFDRRRGIEACAVRGSERALRDETLELAAWLGHGDKSTARRKVEKRQRALLADQWSGGGFVGQWFLGLRAATRSSERTLVWISQQREEASLLASMLDGVRVLGARSMYLLGRERTVEEQLAEAYVDELLEIDRCRSLVLGGNCQGGRLALALASELRRRARPAEQVVVLDTDTRRQSDEDVVFAFGAQSHHNPKNRGVEPRRFLSALIPRHEITEIPGIHGTYFSSVERVRPLVAILERVLAPSAE